MLLPLHATCEDIGITEQATSVTSVPEAVKNISCRKALLLAALWRMMWQAASLHALSVIHRPDSRVRSHWGAAALHKAINVYRWPLETTGGQLTWQTYLRWWELLPDTLTSKPTLCCPCAVWLWAGLKAPNMCFALKDGPLALRLASPGCCPRDNVPSSSVCCKEGKASVVEGLLVGSWWVLQGQHA